MAMRVVDPLEVVDVDEGDRERAPVSVGALDLGLEHRQAGLPIEQAGERIGRRLRLDLGDARGEALDRRVERFDPGTASATAASGPPVGLCEAVGQSGELACARPADDEGEEECAEHRAERDQREVNDCRLARLDAMSALGRRIR